MLNFYILPFSSFVSPSLPAMLSPEHALASLLPSHDTTDSCCPLLTPLLPLPVSSLPMLPLPWGTNWLTCPRLPLTQMPLFQGSFQTWLSNLKLRTKIKKNTSKTATMNYNIRLQKMHCWSWLVHSLSLALIFVGNGSAVCLPLY